MIRAWRIAKSKHAATAFTGDGARLTGARWTSPGVAVVHLADSVPLAILEMLVHVESEELVKRYVLYEASFDGSLVTAADLGTLPRNWRAAKPPESLRRIGDAWHQEGRSAVLRVPSAVVPSEWNYLLNPAHPDFARITIGSAQVVRFDRRLIRD
jgi:RES domain-containing protein